MYRMKKNHVFRLVNWNNTRETVKKDFIYVCNFGCKNCKPVVYLVCVCVLYRSALVTVIVSLTNVNRFYFQLFICFIYFLFPNYIFKPFFEIILFFITNITTLNLVSIVVQCDCVIIVIHSRNSQIAKILLKFYSGCKLVSIS